LGADGEDFLADADGAEDFVAFFRTRPRGGETHVHSHPDSDQILYVLKGECTVEGLDGQYTLLENQGVLIPAGVNYGFTNTAEEDVANPLNKGGPLRVWDVRRRALTAFRGGSAANSIAFSPDGSLLAAAETERGTEVRDASTGRLVKRLVTADFARYASTDPLCCPSSRVTVRYRIDRTAAGPVVAPVEIRATRR